MSVGMYSCNNFPQSIYVSNYGNVDYISVIRDDEAVLLALFTLFTTIIACQMAAAYWDTYFNTFQTIMNQ